VTRPDGADEGSGFLSRWARRKREAGLAEQTPPVEAASDSLAADDISTDAPELPLPSLDDIAPGADLSMFFQKHVPEALRKAALRKLWVTDPAIRDFIEMADYQWDFNNPDSIPGWSSSIGDFDVGKLVGRILGSDGADERDTLPLSGAATESDRAAGTAEPIDGDDAIVTAEPAAEIGELTHSDVISETSRTAANIEETTTDGHGDAADSDSESYSYVPVRKRHGGALPS
jgi:hypothetical protein